MRYLSFMADYKGSCLKDDYDNEIDLGYFGLSKEMLNKIHIWNKKYSQLIPLSEDERSSFNKEITGTPIFSSNLLSPLLSTKEASATTFPPSFLIKS